jgi:hypothetical protein
MFARRSDGQNDCDHRRSTCSIGYGTQPKLRLAVANCTPNVLDPNIVIAGHSSVNRFRLRKPLPVWPDRGSLVVVAACDEDEKSELATNDFAVVILGSETEVEVVRDSVFGSSARIRLNA